MPSPSLLLPFRLPWFAGLWIAGPLVGGALLPSLAHPAKIRVSTYCEKRGSSGIFSAEMKNKYTDMSRVELAAAYVDKVGYDPFQEDPQTTEAEIAQTLAEWDAECAACTVDFVNEALAKRGLDPLDDEQAYFLANPTIAPEQTEGVLEDLHRMGVEVSR